MEKLSPGEVLYFKKLFTNGTYFMLKMSSTDFSNLSISLLGFDLGRKYRGLPAESFESFARCEDINIVIPFIEKLIEYAIAENEHFENKYKELLNKCRDIIKKHSNNNQSYKLPSLDKEGLDILEKDIYRTLADNDYILAVDRLHTYSLFFFEDLCKKNGLTPNKDPKGHVMFDDMIGQLQKKFEEQGILNEFDNESIKNSKIIFQKYNVIRNNGSFAHPNQIIENARAKFLINNIIILLNYFLTLSEQILAK